MVVMVHGIGHQGPDYLPSHSPVQKRFKEIAHQFSYTDLLDVTKVDKARAWMVKQGLKLTPAILRYPDLVDDVAAWFGSRSVRDDVCVAFALFMVEAIKKHVAQYGKEPKDIVMIGHSLGTLVIKEYLKAFSPDLLKRIKVIMLGSPLMWPMVRMLSGKMPKGIGMVEFVSGTFDPIARYGNAAFPGLKFPWMITKPRITHDLRAYINELIYSFTNSVEVNFLDWSKND